MLDTRHHEVAVDELGEVVERFTYDEFVFYLVGNYVGHELARLVFLLDLLIFLVELHLEDGPNHQHRGDDADYTQRIGGGIAQGNLGDFGDRTVEPQLRQGLLCGTQSRGVGNGTRENTHHHGHAHLVFVEEVDAERHSNVENYNTHGQHIEGEPASLERGEEAGSHLQTDGVNKEN